AGLVIAESIHGGFSFEIQDNKLHKKITLNAPDELYDLLMFLGAPSRFAVKRVFNRKTGEIAAVTSTERLTAMAGRYVGKDDPVMVVRCQGNFPAVGEVLEPFAHAFLVEGWMRGSHHGPLMPCAIKDSSMQGDFSMKAHDADDPSGRGEMTSRVGYAPETREMPPCDWGAHRKVLVVHGRSAGPREMVARFLEHLRLEPVILDEQPNLGQTIIEKLERLSDVDFAVVLLTPDDGGRVRQNVLLEWGFCLGRLGRRRVSALYWEGVELPSDAFGLLYIKWDQDGAWRLQLARELLAAGLRIDIRQAVLSSAI
ncbi:MAG: fructose 1,6-bisphosphatase, partial [Chloroflexota bacterium]|nr:fructose 1,6-bisphosphatase [Chloroflexota bacterium]